ncbi:MAG: hypothetical protein ACUZ8I_01610 [Candidatus Scalindua sp.]
MWEGKPKFEGPGLTEQGKVFLRHYELIAEMRPMRKSVRYFRKFAVGYSRHHPQHKKVQADLIAPRLSASLLGGDKKRPCPSGRRGGQAQGERRTLRCCQGMVQRRLTSELS